MFFTDKISSNNIIFEIKLEDEYFTEGVLLHPDTELYGHIFFFSYMDHQYEYMESIINTGLLTDYIDDIEGLYIITENFFQSNHPLDPIEYDSEFTNIKKIKL